MIALVVIGIVIAFWIIGNTLGWLSVRNKGCAPGGYPWNRRIFTRGPWYLDWARDRDKNESVGFWS